VLLEVRRTKQAGHFVDRAHVGENLRGHTRIVLALQNEQPESVVEDMLPDREIVLRLCSDCGGGRGEHAQNGGGDEQKAEWPPWLRDGSGRR
jgi:hypothetical protein